MVFLLPTYVSSESNVETATCTTYVEYVCTLHKVKLAQATQALTKGPDSFDAFIKAHFTLLGPLGVTRY